MQVSRGSVGSNLRFLESQQLIKRVAKSGDRQDYYEVVDNAFAIKVEAVATGVRRAATDIKASLRGIPAYDVGPRARAAGHAAYYRAMAEGRDTTGKALRKSR